MSLRLVWDSEITEKNAADSAASGPGQPAGPSRNARRMFYFGYGMVLPSAATLFCLLYPQRQNPSAIGAAGPAQIVALAAAVLIGASLIAYAERTSSRRG